MLHKEFVFQSLTNHIISSLGKNSIRHYAEFRCKNSLIISRSSKNHISKPLTGFRIVSHYCTETVCARFQLDHKKRTRVESNLNPKPPNLEFFRVHCMTNFPFKRFFLVILKVKTFCRLHFNFEQHFHLKIEIKAPKI